MVGEREGKVGADFTYVSSPKLKVQRLAWDSRSPGLSSRER